MIARVRDLVGDSLSATSAPAFSEQQIQEALDRERVDYILGDLHELAGRYSIVGGAYRWTDYLDPLSYGDWEEDATLYNGGFALITPTSSDYLTGHWTFTDQPPPVFLVGKTYDVYAAARALHHQLIARYAVTGAYDFSADGATFRRSQIIEQLRAQADLFESQMRIGTATLRRSDVRVGW
jgi:hypothetical protein